MNVRVLLETAQTSIDRAELDVSVLIAETENVDLKFINGAVRIRNDLEAMGTALGAMIKDVNRAHGS